MNELAIQNALWRELQTSCSLVMPNYTPARWWENDLFAVTKSGYWIEHEIKLTLSDFKADAGKAKDVRVGPLWWRDPKQERKHDLLAEKSERGPNRFFYVVPEALADQIELPPWAGLKVIHRCDLPEHEDKHKPAHGKVFTTTRVRAPLLHKGKINSDIAEHARGVCYWRFWNLRRDAETELNRRLNRCLQSEPQNVVD